MHGQPQPKPPLLQNLQEPPPPPTRKMSEAERKAGVQRWVAHKKKLYEAYEKGQGKA